MSEKMKKALKELARVVVSGVVAFVTTILSC